MLEGNTELSDIVDTVFKDYRDAPQGGYWKSFKEMVGICL